MISKLEAKLFNHEYFNIVHNKFSSKEENDIIEYKCVLQDKNQPHFAIIKKI